MPELRIILLIVGVLFVAAIAGFEWWRSRNQKAAAAPRPSSREDLAAAEPPARQIKPLPEIHVVREPRVPVPESLPVIELSSTSESGTRRALGISISDDVAVDLSTDVQAGRAEPYIGEAIGEDEVSEVRIVEQPVATAQVAQPPTLSLAWPPEDQRRIVTLRVLPRTEPRFPGRALRQAFLGCGFAHGPLDIYHLPDENGRVILSAAALAQPGTFDPSIMDSQRFSGVNLFAVLPGPLPEADTFEELVQAARQLAERLNGLIADQHGEELTGSRIARLRESLATAPAARASGEA
jgi:cell division protein ZipA